MFLFLNQIQKVSMNCLNFKLTPLTVSILILLCKNESDPGLNARRELIISRDSVSTLGPPVLSKDQ